MIFKKNLMNFIIISIVFASILMSKNWAQYRNATKIKKVYFFGNEFVDNNFLNSFNDEIKNKNIYDININELSKVFEDNHYIKAARVSKHFPDKIKIEIVERNPIAVINNIDPILIDENGIILPNNKEAFKKIIPFLSGFNQNKLSYINGEKTTSPKLNEAIALLKKIKEKNESLYKNISEMALNTDKEFVLVLVDYPTKINIGSSDLDKKIQIIESFDSSINPDGLYAFKSIDLRYQNQIITQGKR